MTENGYDAIVVGARCAGSVAAAELARAGASVAMIDRDELGSDTVSTHTFFPNTIARLDQLGALERIAARHELHPLAYRLTILGNELYGAYSPIEGRDFAYSIRRPVLDRALAEEAIDAGVDHRFGVKLTRLLGSGTEEDPVRGVELQDGTTLEAKWVIGADGRASSVAGALGLAKERPMAGDLSMIFGYWCGVPVADHFTQEAREELGMNLIPCEDDLTLLLVFGPADLTRGDAATRRRRYLEGLAQFPETAEAVAHVDAEMIGDLVVAPETMLRGFFRRAAGPGWALVGDANHFKHPATAQGISDAVEQAIHVAAALGGEDEDLSEYEAWRDARAEGHYEWSFTFGRLPVSETAGLIFAGFAADEQAQQDLRDVMSRTVHPSEALSEERMQRWFAPANAA